MDNTHDAASACADALANVLQFAAVANFSAWLAVSTRHMVAAHSARLLCVVRSDTEGVPASGSEVFDLSEAPNPDAFTWAARAGWQRPGTHENESLRAAQAPASPASPHWSAHPVLVASAERIARGADVRVRHVVAGDAAGSHTLGWGTCAPIEPFMHALTAACAQRALCCVQLLVAVERGDTGSESTLRAGLVAALPSAALALTRDVMADGPVSQTHPPWARSSGSAATAALQELLRAVPLAARRNGVASDVHTATSVMRGLCEVVAGTAVDNTVARTLQQVHSFRWCTQRASVLPDEWWVALDEHPTAPALHAGLSVFRSPHATLGAAMRRAQSRLAASGISEHLVRTVLDACGAFAYNVRLREAAATLAIGCMHRACGSRAASMASPYIVASFASMWRLPHDEVLTPSTPVASASTPADDSAAGAGATSSAATLPAPAAAASQQQPVSRPAPAAAGAHRGLRHDPT
ncbi:MAG: hypothetical protein EOO41_03150 [Methanobacteriota archaeon]|nr:MAG: hypothetical protein EOO41_03150 [Euryarchaeota archaeon]